MPHRQIIHAAQLQLGAAISHNMLTTDPQEIPHMAAGWSIELKQVLVDTVGPDEAMDLLNKRIREIEQETHGRRE